MRWVLGLGLLSVVVCASPAFGQAQGLDEADAWAYAMAHDLMSPFCPGRTLAECPSPQADELRIWILTQAAAGATRGEVEEALYERFGDQILSAPRPEGWGLAAYVIPIVGFVVGGGLVWLALSRLVRRGQPAPTPAPPVQSARSDAELERLIDEELGA
jgi:cytochrome c-type biogenesis protein CcmH